MILPSVKDRREYILQSERDLPPDLQTIWIFRPLTVHQKREIEDNMGLQLTGEGYKAGTFTYKALKYGLAGWKNLKREDGSEVAFKTGGDGLIQDELIGQLPLAVRMELATAIYDLNLLSEVDRKNLP